MHKMRHRPGLERARESASGATPSRMTERTTERVFRRMGNGLGIIDGRAAEDRGE